MNKRRVISLFMIIMLCFGVTASAKPREDKGATFMGEVIEIKKDGDQTSLLVEGYLNGCNVYKEKLLVHITNETRIKLACDEENAKNEEKQDDKDNKEKDAKDEKKQENKDSKGKEGTVQEVKIDFNKGDTVFMILDKAMTKSIPPQVNAKFIKVTKAK